MSLRPSDRAIGLIERLVGRRRLWRIGRVLYKHARRDGAGTPETNGEYALHERLARWAGSLDRPLRIIDVGANIGYWSWNLLQACERAGVARVELLGFEPSQEIRDQFVERMASVRAGFRVSVRPEAVSDAPGRAAFDATPGISGVKHLLSDDATADQATPSIDVDVTTLTKVFEEEGFDSVDFVKTDVEGFDLFAIRGAVPLLEAGRIGLFQFEYNHRWVYTRTYLRDVFELVEGLPYRVGKVVPEGIHAYPSWHPELEAYFEVNYVLVRDDLMDAFGVEEGTFAANNTYAT